MKVLKRIVIVLIILILVVGGAVFAGMYYIGDMAIDSALDSLVQPETKPDPSGQASGNITGGANEAVGSGQSGKRSSTEPVQETDGSKSAPAESDPLHFTDENVQAIKDQVTLNDKLLASKIVLSKLTSDELNYLTGLLAGGVTDEEFSEAKQFALKKFSKEDISEIYSIYKKYVK